ncbi:MAG TPA: glycoside hydrolase family 76 protein, partial [Candidatus Sulfotelmatobacter sp.]|nr:glycoside hydrolase family 76 protein [Candidatus Sulfotelmatobacter sp.]
MTTHTWILLGGAVAEAFIVTTGFIGSVVAALWPLGLAACLFAFRWSCLAICRRFWPFALVLVLLGWAGSARALNATNADTLLSAYNTAFYTPYGSGGYYKMDTGSGTGAGWWTYAEEIEMALDSYDRTESAATKTLISALCNGFTSKNGSSWIGNEYNDDIAWAVIAFCRAYLITGNTTFRDRAKSNFDAMYSRAWDTSFTGGGLWWRTDKQCKNACVNGPGAVAACYLYEIYGDAAYLAKAQDCYAWERRVLFSPTTGAIYDSINTNNSYNTWASTYNQGTFIGAGNFLFKYTGLPFYYQDSLLAANYTKNSLCTAGILPVYNSGDLAGFNGIFARWMGKMARDQNLWNTFSGWLSSNADAAWNVRNTNNLAWYNWRSPTPAGTNVLASWDCSGAVVIAQVGCTNAPDALRISPNSGFTAVVPYSSLPASNSLDLILTNSGAAALTWGLGSTSVWLSASATNGTLAAAGSAATVTLSLNTAGVTNLPAGRYYAMVWVTNQTSALVQKRLFTLLVSGANTPIALSGFNARIVAPNTATISAPNATALDLINGYALYQAGLGTSTRGLPPDGVFTSLFDSNTLFQIG